jgi:electron transport complex protein RnfA
MFIKRFSKKLYKSLGIYLPLITTNCAILGIVELNIAANYATDFGLLNGLGVAMSSAIGAAAGFMLVIVAFSAIRERLDGYPLPESWKGVPVSLVVASIMALAFLGLGGIV